MPATLLAGCRQILARARNVFAGGSAASGGVASTNKSFSASGTSLTHAASRLASERVERSELVSSPLGDSSNTADEAPLSGETRLSFISEAIHNPNGSPQIPTG